MLDIIRIAIPQLLARFGHDEKAAAMVEYGLLVALIAVVAAAGVTIVGTNLSAFFTAIGGWIATYTAGIP